MSEELGQRALACKGWRWMPGMLTTTPAGQTWRLDECDDRGGDPGFGREWGPDLTDPATLGCLLALVREAYGNPRAVICWQGGAQCGYWETFVADSEITADTEAEALVAALECAP